MFEKILAFGVCSTAGTTVSLEFGAYSVTGQCGEFRIENATLCFHMFFWHLFIVFHHKICVFIIFISSFDEVYKFHNRILTNQKQKLVIRNCQ